MDQSKGSKSTQGEQIDSGYELFILVVVVITLLMLAVYYLPFVSGPAKQGLRWLDLYLAHFFLPNTISEKVSAELDGIKDELDVVKVSLSAIQATLADWAPPPEEASTEPDGSPVLRAALQPRHIGTVARGERPGDPSDEVRNEPGTTMRKSLQVKNC